MPHIPVIFPSIFSLPLFFSPSHSITLPIPKPHLSPPVQWRNVFFFFYFLFSGQFLKLSLIFNFFSLIVWDYGCGSFEQLNDVFHFTFAKNQFALRNWGKKDIMRNLCNFWKEINGFDQTGSWGCWNKNGFWMLNFYLGAIEYGHKNVL